MNETIIESVKTVNDTMKEAIAFIKASFKDVVLDASGILQNNLSDLKDITGLKYTLSLYATPAVKNSSIWTYSLFIGDTAYSDKDFKKFHKKISNDKKKQVKKEIAILLNNAKQATTELQKMIYLKKGNTLVLINHKRKKIL